MPDGLDLLVSNAGISIMRSINNSLDRYHDFTRTMAINYFAPVQLLLSTIPLLEKNQGHIINISTINVLLIPIPYWAAYQASKSAFDTWFRSAAPELNAMGISTTSIYLPLVKTRMILPTTAYQKVPAMSPDHVAKIICKSMYTKRRNYKPWWLIFGQLASIIFRGIWELSAPNILRKRRKRKKMFKLIYVLYKMRLLSPFGLYRLISAIFKYGINVMALLCFAERAYGNKIALVDENETLSYKQLLSQSEKLSIVLKEKYQLKSGQKVGFLCKNHASLVKSIFAVS